MIKVSEKIIKIKDKSFLFCVEDSPEASDYQKYEDLRQAIWEFAEDHLAGTRNLMCENFLHEGSSLFTAVFEEGEAGGFPRDGSHLVGFSYGFVGLKDKLLGFDRPENLWFYSQFMGVRPDRINYGLGILIKEFQKEVLLSIFHIKTVVCTYDPLTAVNAYRNVRYFGMEVLEYRVAPYGEYGGRLNRQDVPSDRFFMVWDLERNYQPVVPEIEIGDYVNNLPKALEVSNEQIQGKMGPVVLEVIKRINADLTRELILIQIPGDYYFMLRATDVRDSEIRAIPVDWRHKTREVFLEYIKKGYRVVDFFKQEGKPRTCFYLLKRRL
jgi:predicted GNAT superfamily acetyltransferase